MFSLFLMVLAVSAYWQTLNLSVTESKTGLLTGPAFFPQWLAILFFICCAIIFGKTYLQAEDVLLAQAFPAPRRLLKIFVFLAMIGLTVILTPLIGWLAAQFIMVLVIEVALEKRKWASAVGISLTAAAAVYAIFELGLGVRLPRGFLD